MFLPTANWFARLKPTRCSTAQHGHEQRRLLLPRGQLNSSCVLSSGTTPVSQQEVNVYYPFGRTVAGKPQAGFKVSRQFTGQIKDDETGLYYYNARYYDPELGRFIQADRGFQTSAIHRVIIVTAIASIIRCAILTRMAGHQAIGPTLGVVPSTGAQPTSAPGQATGFIMAQLALSIRWLADWPSLCASAARLERYLVQAMPRLDKSLWAHSKKRAGPPQLFRWEQPSAKAWERWLARWLARRNAKRWERWQEQPAKRRKQHHLSITIQVRLKVILQMGCGQKHTLPTPGSERRTGC